MQNKGGGSNSFNGGLNTDGHPLVVKNSEMTDALNAEIMTVGEGQYILKNIPGNVLDVETGKGFKLTEGFIPLAVKNYNNISYIISGKFDDNGEFLLGELGTYPSPEWAEYGKDYGDYKEIYDVVVLHTEVDYKGEIDTKESKYIYSMTVTKEITVSEDTIGLPIRIKLELPNTSVFKSYDKAVITLSNGINRCNEYLSYEVISTESYEGDEITFKIDELESNIISIRTEFYVSGNIPETNLSNKWFTPCSFEIIKREEDEEEKIFYVGLLKESDLIAINTIDNVHNTKLTYSKEEIKEFYTKISDRKKSLIMFPHTKMEDYYDELILQIRKLDVNRKYLKRITEDIVVVKEIKFLILEDIGNPSRNVATKLVKKYAPIHNFLTEEFEPIKNCYYTADPWVSDECHKLPFRTNSLGFSLDSFIDLTLQREYDNSINFIFTDDINPVRMINSRFKINEDGTATIIDRRHSKDTNTYSSEFFNQTELILKSSDIPELVFDGVMLGGKLKGGGYRYYFRHKNSDGNVSDIIAESRLVSIHQGIDSTAYGVTGNEDTDKAVKFTLKGLGITSGTVEVTVTHVFGDNNPVANTYIIKENYYIREDGACHIEHSGIEEIEIVNESSVNTEFSSVGTVKTLDQINNRLVLANITSSVDEVLFGKLEMVSQKLRISEEIVEINTGYDNPKTVYNDLGYWGGETYELAIVYVLKKGGLSPAFPTRGLDNFDGLGKYSGDITDSEDIKIATTNGIASSEHFDKIPDMNRFENVRGLYRTFHDKYLMKVGKRQVTKLTLDLSRLVDGIDRDAAYINERVSGYFIVRKLRRKDVLFQGFVGPTARMPIGNIESTVFSYDFIGFKRNTAVHPRLGQSLDGGGGRGEIDPSKFYLGYDNGESDPILQKSSDIQHNLYDLTMAVVPQFSSNVPVVHPSGKTFFSEKGRVPRSNKVAFYSGDMEVDPINLTTILNNSKLNVNININNKVTLSDSNTSRVQLMVDKSSTLDIKVPLTLKNTLGEGRVIGENIFVPSGSIVAAEGEFTGQIDRTMNFLYTSASGGTPVMSYRHLEGYGDEKPKSGFVYMEDFFKDADESIMKINFIDNKGINRESYCKALKKGDRIVTGNNDVYNITNQPKYSTYGIDTYVYFTVDNDDAIDDDWSTLSISFEYLSTIRLLFFPIAYDENHQKALGLKSSDAVTQLWGDGSIGINRYALWRTSNDDGTLQKEYLFPYVSVAHNYSNYVGMVLSQNTAENFLYVFTSNTNPSARYFSIKEGSDGSLSLKLSSKDYNGKSNSSIAVKKSDVIVINGPNANKEYAVIEDPTISTTISIKCMELGDDLAYKNFVPGAKYIIKYAKRGEYIFEHDIKNNFLYLTEVKSSFNSLDAANLVEIYSTTNSTPYFSVTNRFKLKGGNKIVKIADGDCFITKTFKRVSYAIGILDAPTANFSDFNTYGSGPITQWLRKKDDGESGWGKASSSETMDEGRKLASNGHIVELVSQTNHNSDVRSYEPAAPLEKMIYGTDRGFYPKVKEGKLYTEYRPDSKAYNRGLTGDYRVISYVSIDVEAPIYNLNYSNRIMISSPNIQSEFFNGYRDISGINYKDYNSELGQIIKVVTYNNVLFVVFENGIAAVTVDGRTLINSESDIYIDDAQVLASKATVINAKVGSINPESIIISYSTIFGVDFIRNKIWKVSGSAVEVITDYKIEQFLIDAKDKLIKVGVEEKERGKPRIYGSFDAIKKNVHFSYNKLLNIKEDSNFFYTFGSMYYNEVMGAWTSKTSYSPKYQTTYNEFNMLFDVNVLKSEAWLTGVNAKYCNFHGIQYKFYIEFIMHERPDIEKVLTNLQILSNKVKPEEITYLTTTDIPNAVLRQNVINYYDEEGNLIPNEDIDYTDLDNIFNTTHVDKIYIREDSIDMSIGIFKENAYYKDGKYFVQVGKSESFSRFNKSTKRIRDKYFKIKIQYSGEDYTYLYSVISLFTNNYD
ncbi:MAG: hypothetical protein KAH32_04715 [Chlamydiia bacterium]|nr:hypothetical protein [Chlamydiia bacterium]